MNAKHLFLTLSMLLASFTFAWATPVTDNITLSSMLSTYSPAAQNSFNVSGYAASSDARYAGRLYYYAESGEESTLGFFEADNRLVSTTSGGVLKSVSVTWGGTYNLSGESTITVYGSNTPYIGSETRATLSSKTPIATIVYPAVTTTDLSSLGYKYVAIVGTPEMSDFTALRVEWMPPTKYTVTMDGGFTGQATVNVNDGAAATAGATLASVEAGELVKISIKPKRGKSATGFTFGDMVFDFECFGYIEPLKAQDFYVYMPSENVTLSVDVIAAPKKQSNIPVFDCGASTEVGSGATKVVTFQLPYYNGTGTRGDTIYTGTVSCSSSDAAALQVSLKSMNMTTGVGSITITGLIGPTADVNVHIGGSVFVLDETYILPVTVTPRQAALIAKYGDEYYAMLNDVNSEGHASAERIYKGSDSKYYYDPTSGTSLLDMTWNIMNEDVDGDQFTIQHPTTEEFLTLPSTKLKFSDASFSWVRDDGFLIGATGLSYNPTYKGSDFGSIRYDFTYGVYDVIIGENFIPFETYSTNSAADINDPRTLTPGNYGTFCSPYDVPSVAGVGAKFFTLEGKVVSGENLAGIVISDPVDELVAGHAYLYQVDEGSDAINLERCMRHLTKASTSTEDGFVGCLADDNGGAGKVYATAGVSPRSDGDYMLKDNKLHYVPTGATGSARTYRAFIRAKELTEVKAGSVPKRRIVIVDGFTGEIGSEDSETSVDELVDSSELNWDKPVYNIMGVRVSKGATGVLIQNGHKFFVK